MVPLSGGPMLDVTARLVPNSIIFDAHATIMEQCPSIAIGLIDAAEY